MNVFRDIHEGFRQSVNAMRTWRENPMLPFVLRGLAGGHSPVKTLLPVVIVCMVLSPLASLGMSSAQMTLYNQMSIQLLGTGGPLLFLLSIIIGILWLPVGWKFLVPVGLAIATRRWISSEQFKRDVVSIPEGLIPLAAALVVTVSALGVLCDIASNVVAAFLYWTRVYEFAGDSWLPYIYSSNFTRLWLDEMSRRGPVGLAVLTEIFARICGFLQLASQFLAYFIVVLIARGIIRGVLIVVVLNAVWQMMAYGWWRVMFTMSRDFLSPTGSSAYSGLPVDLIYRPLHLVYWLLLACWLIIRLRVHIAMRLAPADDD